jgi:hypothetical protein
VGIGTAPTLQKLEVNGNTNITGSLSVQSADINTYRTPSGIFGNINCVVILHVFYMRLII